MKSTFLIPALLVLLCLTAVVSLCLGRYPVAPGQMISFLSNGIFGSLLPEERGFAVIQNIVVDIRLPRIMAAILIGSALSVSGVAFQSMFINPLVSPGLLGVLAGASFGAALGMILSVSWIAVQAGAFIFGFVAVLTAICIAGFYKGDRLLMLILGGIISGSMFTALLSVIKYLADPYDMLPAIVYWLMGGLSMADAKTVWTLSFPIAGGIVMLIFLSGQMNVLSMGDEEARSMGVNVGRIRFLLIFFATLISALTVAIGGIIGWVGLVIPHIARMIVGSDNRILLPAAAIIGATYLLVVDNISRLAFSVEIPLGILTALAGIPFFTIVLRNSGKGWN
ncbi:FecCD family ABC transporter permease [Desulfobacula phenolica]|uniref:Iron complex transport system permease protein n=1 Tax=Desulfobacula phenolica TaxID=90732 RepID=A0A1H2HID5_9BACT|nr:iron ABC transporter permease [Desulfobacula phenolica]SDU31641.1 iron complex transport system permease protein [Desulfobacula phenolica]